MKIRMIMANGYSPTVLSEIIKVEHLGYTDEEWLSLSKEMKLKIIKEYIDRYWYVDFEE